MTQLLLVETSVRGDQSVSRQMSRRFLAAWQTRNPQGRVVERDLVRTSLSFVTQPWLRAYFTPLADQSEVMRHELKVSDELVAELLATDRLVISTPVYNYNIPASLKAWVDHIVRKGAMLGFDGRGLVKGKKATVLLASGGVYTDGSPIQDRDIATQYLLLILGVIGIEDVDVVAGEGAKAVDLREQAMDAFVDLLQLQIDRAAGALVTRPQEAASLARSSLSIQPTACERSVRRGRCQL